MTSARGRSEYLQQLVRQALKLPADQREAWLARRAGEDKRLLHELQVLLEKYDQPQTKAGPLDTIELPQPEAAPERPRGLRIHCPHCHNAVEVLKDADDALEQILCESCGSSFQIVEGRTTTYSSECRRIGRFTLVEQLGVGAYGVVWRGRDAELDREVAVKIPREGRLSPEEQAKFLREARAAAQLAHPHIVAVHEIGRDDGRLYIVSDLVRGLTLADWLTGQTASPRQAAEWCAKIADALDHAHQQGVVHRDLKPSNVLLDEQLEPRITDFGLAKRDAGEITMTIEGQVLGTPAYMSPEQARGSGHNADRRSDIYSLGVILFELLTGERPFRGNARMLIHQVLSEDAPSPRKLDASIPRDLETICLKCLEKDPAKRYSTARELAEELRRWLRGEPVLARPISRAARAVRWAHRNRAIAALATTVLVVLLTGIVVSGSFAVLANRHAQELQIALWNVDAQRSRADQQAAQAIARSEEARRERNRALQAEREMRRLLYQADMRNAFQALSDGNTGRVREHLLAHVPEPGQTDLRGWEWYHLWDRIHDYTTLLPHMPAVTSLAISKDGRYLASVDASWGMVRFWELPTGQLVSLIREATNLRHVEFSPDGTLLTAGKWDVTEAPIWNWQRGLPQTTLEAPASLFVSVAWHPAGNLLAGGSKYNGRIQLFDVSTGEVVRGMAVPTSTVGRITFSPDGSLLAARANSGEIHLIDMESGETRTTLPGSGGYGFEFFTLRFSADGERLVTSGPQGTHLWDVRSPGTSTQLEGHSAVNDAVFSPDGRIVYTAGDDGRVVAHRADNGQPLQAYLGHAQRARALVMSSDGKLLVSAGEDGLILVRDLARQTPTVIDQSLVLAHSPPNESPTSRSAAFLPDGRMISAWGKHIIIWNEKFTAPESLIDTGTSVHRFAVSPTGAICASYHLGDQRIALWDVAQGSHIGTLEARTHVNCLAFSPDGEQLLAGGRDRHGFVVWDLQTLSRHHSLRIDHWANRAAWSPDRKTIAAASDLPGPVQLYDAESARPRMTLARQDTEIYALAFSPDGRMVVSGGADANVTLSDAASGETISVLRGHIGSVLDLTFSPDGNLLASAATDGTVRLWDIPERRERAVFSVGKDKSITTVCFSPDGRTLVAVEGDHLHIWRAASEDDVAAQLSRERALQNVSRLELLESLVRGHGRRDLEPDLAHAIFMEAYTNVIQGDIKAASAALERVEDLIENAKPRNEALALRWQELAYYIAELRPAMLMAEGRTQKAQEALKEAYRLWGEFPQELQRRPLAGLALPNRGELRRQRLAAATEAEFERAVAEEFLFQNLPQPVTITLVDGTTLVLTTPHDVPDEPFHVREIRLWSDSVSDADIEILARLPELEALTIFESNETPIDSAIIDKLSLLRRLRRLSLDKLSSRTLTHVAQLRQLEQLTLRGADLSQLSEDDLAAFGRMGNVRWLELDGTAASNELVRAIATMPNLEYLNLARTPVADEALRELAECSGLKYLILDSTLVSDEGVIEILTLPSLRELLLRETNVTDAIVEAALRRAEPLDYFGLNATRVSSRGVALLRHAWPNCELFHDASPETRNASRSFPALDTLRQRLNVVREEIASGASTAARWRSELVPWHFAEQGTPHGVEIASLLRTFPWPLDQLERAALSDEQRRMMETVAGRVPEELVAVFGDGRLTFWGEGFGRAAFGEKHVAVLSYNGNYQEWNSANGLFERVVKGWPSVCGLSPDGSLAASTDENTLRVWETADAAVVREWDGVGTVRFVAFRPGADQIAVALANGRLKLYSYGDVTEPIEVRSGGPAAVAVDFDPSGEYLVERDSDMELRVWRVHPLSDHPAPIASVRTQHGTDRENRLLAVARDAKVIAVAGTSAIELYFGHDGTRIGQIDLRMLNRDNRRLDLLDSLAISPDGSLLVGGDNSGQIGFWSVPDGQNLGIIRERVSWVNILEFSDDGKLLAAGGHDSLTLIDPVLRTVVAQADPLAGVNSLVVSPQGDQVFAGSVAVTAWRIPEGSPAGQMGDRYFATALANHAQAPGLWIYQLWQINLFNPRSMKSQRQRAIPLRVDGPFTINSAGTTLAVGGQELELWDLQTGTRLPSISRSDGKVVALALSDDGTLIAACIEQNDTQRLELFNTVSGKLIHSFEVPEGQHLTCLAFSPDSRILVGAGWGGPPRRWKVDDGSSLSSLDAGEVSGLDFSPDGRWLAALGRDETIRIWDAVTGEAARTIALGEDLSDAWLRSLSFAPDSRHLLVGTASGMVLVFRIEEQGR